MQFFSWNFSDIDLYENWMQYEIVESNALSLISGLISGKSVIILHLKIFRIALVEFKYNLPFENFHLEICILSYVI